MLFLFNEANVEGKLRITFRTDEVLLILHAYHGEYRDAQLEYYYNDNIILLLILIDKASGDKSEPTSLRWGR